MKKETIRLSRKELARIKIIHSVIDNRMSQKEAAEKISISSRHLRRLVKKILVGGDAAIAHGNRGRHSNRRYSDEFKDRVINIVRPKLSDSLNFLLKS